MIILDTNVISSLMRDPADEAVLAWLDQQPRTSVWITAITMLEIHFGLEIMANGRRKAFKQLIGETLERRIAFFDAAAAQETAVLMGSRQRRGEPRDLRDSMIAGIALARRAVLATHNVKHFDDAGIEIVNPLQT
jgi:predicted nucleic acid-binding protein